MYQREQSIHMQRTLKVEIDPGTLCSKPLLNSERTFQIDHMRRLQLFRRRPGCSLSNVTLYFIGAALIVPPLPPWLGR